MATKANLVIDQGTDYNTTLNLTDDNGDPLNLTGYTANSVIKKWYTSQTSVPFTVTIDANNGIITLLMNSALTANMCAGRYVYDIELIQTATNTHSRVVEGMVTVTPAVTSGIFSTNNTWFAANGYTGG
jgi:hypothetical protein